MSDPIDVNLQRIRTALAKRRLVTKPSGPEVETHHRHNEQNAKFQNRFEWNSSSAREPGDPNLSRTSVKPRRESPHSSYHQRGEPLSVIAKIKKFILRFVMGNRKPHK
jgi:hypothetical protein